MRSFGTTIDNLIDEELAYGASDYELVWYKNEELVEIHTSKLRFHFGGPKIPIGNITKDYIEIETDYMDFYKGDAIRIEMKKGEQSISVGPFYVDKFTKKKKASYVAYSSLLDLAQIKLTKYESDLSYAYIKDMVVYYMTPLGISFEPTNCPHINKAYIIDKWETFTMYDLAEAVALTDACNFTLQGNVLRKKNVNGSIAKVYKSKDVVYTDGKSKYEEDTYLDSIKMNYTSYYFSLEGLNCEEATYVVAPYGTQDNTLELNFKFIPYANTIDIVTQFYDDVIEDKVLLNDYEVPFLGDPRIEVGDVISFESEDGTVCTFRVGELVWEWDGGLKCIASTGSVTTNQSSAGGFTSIQQMADALVSMSNSLMTVRYNAVYTNELYANVADLGFASVEELSAEVAKMGLMTAEEADIKYMTVSSADMKYATIDLSNIANGTITNAMIATGAIGTAQIADGSITDAKIVGLTANKITAGTLDAATIEVVNLNAANITVGTINGQQISKGTISLNNLASDVTDKLAATEEDVAQAVADAKQAVLDSASATATANTANSNASTALSTANSAKTIADEVDSTVSDWSYDDDRQCINGAVLYTGTVVANAIAAGAIVSDKIATSAVTAVKIAAGAISTDKLAANAVTAAKIASGTITATQIAASTITGAKIAGETITATNIASSAITTDKIVASAVTAAKIATGAITTDKLAANAVTAAKIAAGTITATQIAASTITSDKLKVTSLSAISANLGTVTAGVIKSTNYVANSAGMKLDLSTGVWDSKYFKLSNTGAITATSGKIGCFDLTSTGLTNSVLKIISNGSNTAQLSVYAPSITDPIFDVGMSGSWNYFVAKAMNEIVLAADDVYLNGNVWVKNDISTEDGISLRGLNSNFSNYAALLSSPTFGTVYTSNWFRSTGGTGWYSETYGGGWHMTDVSYIRAFNGKHVYTSGEVRGDSGLAAVGLNNGALAQLTLAYNTSYFRIRNDGNATYFMNGNSSAWSNHTHMNTAGDWYFPAAIHTSGVALASHVRPQSNGGSYCGTSSYRWADVYSQKSSNNTSDRNLKHDINPISDMYEQLFFKMKPVSYMFNSGDRIHWGFISQDLEESMNELGLTSTDCAAFCKDVKVKYVTDAVGNEVETPVLDKNGQLQYIYGIRYGEFIALNTHMIQKLYSIIEKQNERIIELEKTYKGE